MIPPGVTWSRWRLLTSDKMRITRSDLRAMSFDEFHQAHCVLDALDAAEMQANEKAEQSRYDRPH